MLWFYARVINCILFKRHWLVKDLIFIEWNSRFLVKFPLSIFYPNASTQKVLSKNVQVGILI